jgi:UPF0755 protein
MPGSRWIIPVVLWGLLVWTVVYILTFMLVPASRGAKESLIEITEGMGLGSVARLLKQEGLISNEAVFIVFGKLSGAERQIQKGQYLFDPAISPFEILSALRSGRVLLHDVTIPEGYTMDQIARVMEERELATHSEFMYAATDRSFMAELRIDAESAEGYLFPDTYHFPKDIGAYGIIRAMVSTFEGAFTPEMSKRMEALSLTRGEVVTLASIIEKETSVDRERTLISAVFHNRLKRRIPLQSDPTVIYAIPEFDGNLRRKDLSIHSPYNTYRFSGLPPGPIASPGKDSLIAALYPDSENFFYFVSKNDGTHHFSKTLSEHNKAVDRYQRKRTRVKRSGS